MTHRVADESGWELRSSPLRYGNKHLGVPAFHLDPGLRFLWFQDEPLALGRSSRWKAIPAFSVSRVGMTIHSPGRLQ